MEDNKTNLSGRTKAMIESIHLKRKKIDDIQVGWFSDYSNDDYHNGILRTLISSTDWKEFAKSPAHYMASKQQPKESTSAMNFGSAFHSICMEFESEVVIMPEINRRTKIGKSDYAAFMTENKDKYVITANEMKSIKAMVGAVNHHRLARGLIKTPFREITGIFQDFGTDLWCKIRPDYIDFDKRIISDLKTTIDAGELMFTKQIFSLYYNWSAAWYKHGARILTGDDFSFMIIAVEKTPPYGVNIFVIDGKAIRIGWEAIFGLIGDFAECMSKNSWPSYKQRIIRPDIPGWIKYNQ